MLVFAAHVPNSPLLMEGVNTARLKEAEGTLAALEELSRELYATHPDTVVILAESTVMYPDAFSLNVADPYTADLSSVGDLGYHKTYHPDFGFIDSLQRFARKNNVPISLSTDEKLSFSASVPLHYLTKHLGDIRIVPIAPCELDEKAHFAFGSTLKHLVIESEKRIAVISAGDMAHEEHAKEFEDKIMDILKSRNSTGLLQLDPTLIKNAKDTSYRQLCMLFGLLDGIDVSVDILKKEKPFGVGYAVVNFML